MKTKERRERLQNKGFTLIELIVTIAIIAIFSGVVLTFISTGSNTYRSTSSSAKVQMETQETFDQIEELIIDVNRSLYYANGSGDSLGAEIRNDIKQSGGANSTGDKTFIICNEYKNGTGNSQYICDVLDWDKDDATIYYSQKEFKAASSSVESETSVEALMAAEDDTEEENAADAGASESETKAKDLKTKVDRSVLATGILDFRADVSKVESDKIVRFQLSTQNGTKEIETLHSVSLRNTVEVKKPADSYDDAPSTSVGIKIINAPSSVDRGNSYTLDYNLTGNGKIDPTTIKWEVTANKENGSFPTADPTYGKLTISDTASGTITVIVSARTVDGDMITSAPVTISINGKSATPDSFTLSTNSILVAAGDGPYDLSTIIKGTLSYSDNTTADVKNPIAWSIKNSCTGVSLNGSQLTVTDEAGKDSANGSVTLTATEKDSGANKSADLEVRIARIDLTQPVGTYKVGDAKPQPRTAQVYKESGQDTKIDGTEIEISAQKTNGTTGDYLGGANTFSADDVGEWTVNISYDLKKQGGYGTVHSQSTFTVEADTETARIVCGSDKVGTIFAGGQYTCTGDINNHSYFYMDGVKINYHVGETYKTTWKIEGADPGTSLSPLNLTQNDNATLVVASGEDGFVLSAHIEVYNKDGEAVRGYDASLHVRVINDIRIIEPREDMTTVVRGKTYPMEAKISYGYLDNNMKPQKGTIDPSETNMNWSISNGPTPPNKTEWTVETYNKFDTTVKVKAQVSEAKGAQFGKKGWSTVLSSEERIFTIEGPKYTLTIKDGKENASGEWYVGDIINLSVNVKDENGKEVKINDPWNDIGWEFPNNSWNVSGDNLNPGIATQNLTDGSYTIKAIYKPTGTTATYNLKLKKLTYNLEIVAGKSTLSPGESTQIYLKVMTEKGLYNAQYVSWNTNAWEKLKLNGNGNAYQNDIYMNGKSIPITVTAGAESMDVTVTASFNLNNQQYEVKKIIKIK